MNTIAYVPGNTILNYNHALLIAYHVTIHTRTRRIINSMNLSSTEMVNIKVHRI